jgi:hypothetical protein
MKKSTVEKTTEKRAREKMKKNEMKEIKETTKSIGIFLRKIPGVWLKNFHWSIRAYHESTTVKYFYRVPRESHSYTLEEHFVSRDCQKNVIHHETCALFAVNALHHYAQEQGKVFPTYVALRSCQWVCAELEAHHVDFVPSRIALEDMTTTPDFEQIRVCVEVLDTHRNRFQDGQDQGGRAKHKRETATMKVIVFLSLPNYLAICFGHHVA